MPAFNINNFRSHLYQRGTLLTNKFDVEFRIPDVLNGVAPDRYSNMIETLNYRADQIRLPGISLDSFQVNRYGLGPSMKFPTSVSFTDISITFTEDRNVTLWKFHNEWISRIFDYTGVKGEGTTGPYTLQYRDAYTIDIIINVYNNDPGVQLSEKSILSPSIQVVLKDAYPVSINDINLDWSQNNSLFKPVITYTFKNWYIKDFFKEQLTFKGGGNILQQTQTTGRQQNVPNQPIGPTQTNLPRPIILP
jgi:hypothetical protein